MTRKTPLRASGKSVAQIVKAVHVKTLTRRPATPRASRPKGNERSDPGARFRAKSYRDRIVFGFAPKGKDLEDQVREGKGRNVSFVLSEVVFRFTNAQVDRLSERHSAFAISPCPDKGIEGRRSKGRP